MADWLSALGLCVIGVLLAAGACVIGVWWGQRGA